MESYSAVVRLLYGAVKALLLLFCSCRVRFFFRFFTNMYSLHPFNWPFMDACLLLSSGWIPQFQNSFLSQKQKKSWLYWRRKYTLSVPRGKIQFFKPFFFFFFNKHLKLQIKWWRGGRECVGCPRHAPRAFGDLVPCSKVPGQCSERVLAALLLPAHFFCSTC